MSTCFINRTEAGKQLGRVLADEYGHRDDVIVLALPRGGVPVGLEVARALRAPLDLLLVRKLGVPGHEELAMGALTSDTLILDRNLISTIGVTQEQIDFAMAHEQRELERRERLYRANRPSPNVRGRTVILVDDGMATGASMKAAVEALRHRDPGRIVVAAPLGPAETCSALELVADEVVCLVMPTHFFAIGPHYQEFPQVSDLQVRQCMDAAAGIHATV